MATVVILLDQFYSAQLNQSIWTALWDVGFASSSSISESHRCAASEVFLAATSILQDESQFPRIFPVLCVSSVCSTCLAETKRKREQIIKPLSLGPDEWLRWQDERRVQRGRVLYQSRRTFPDVTGKYRSHGLSD